MSDKTTYLNFLRDKKGYTQQEINELDSQMIDSFSESWIELHIDSEEPIKYSLWLRFKIWLAYIVSGREKPKYEISEYQQYINELIENSNRRFFDPFNREEIREIKTDRRLQRSNYRNERRINKTTKTLALAFAPVVVGFFVLNYLKKR